MQIENIKSHFLRSSNTMVAITDLAGKIIFVSDLFCQVCEYSREELIGKNHRIINSGFHPKKFFEEMYATITEGNIWSGEIRNKTKRGKYIWMTSTIIPLRDEFGRLKEYFSIRTDITERVYLQEKLKQSESRYSSLLENLEAGIVVHAADTQIILNNSKANELLGMSNEQLRGKYAIDPYWKLVDEDGYDLPLEMFPVNRVLSSQASIKNQIIGVHRPITQDIVWLTVNGLPIFNLEGQLIEAVMSFIDITESRKSFNSLKGYAIELEKSSNMKDKFFSIIGHDLRNPFAAIIGLSEMLERMGKQEQNGNEHTFYEKYVEIIHKTAKSAHTLLENLLQWAKSQAGEIRVNLLRMNLDMLIDSIILIVNASALKKNISIEKNISIHDEVYGDESLLSTVLRNLLTNAIKFTNVDGKILITAERKENFLEISIIDNGVGINPEKLGKIFGIGFSISEPGTENETGTGLGLILCKEFVEKQGGTIWVTSELGVGSKFTFTLPLAK